MTESAPGACGGPMDVAFMRLSNQGRGERGMGCGPVDLTLLSGVQLSVVYSMFFEVCDLQ